MPPSSAASSSSSSLLPTRRTDRKARWYFGGLGSAGAACCTHPLDLLKVHLQTQQQANVGLWRMGVKVVRDDGVRALYNGISASLLRQLTYSTTRFAVYELVKQRWDSSNRSAGEGGGRPLPFLGKVLLAGCSGGLGGVVGTPPDLVNVRMQNDMKLPAAQRRNYRHALDGLWRVWRSEGLPVLFNGCTMASSRAVMMTIGQVAMYDQIKQLLVQRPGPVQLPDRLATHLLASSIAAGIATTLTQPLDVMKTRMMNAKPGTYKTIFHCAKGIFEVGPLGFFKGYVPAFIRLLPQTVLTFVFFEQLRLWFGLLPPPPPPPRPAQAGPAATPATSSKAAGGSAGAVGGGTTSSK